MYTLKQGWMAMIGEMPMENWDGKIHCLETDAALTFRTNETEGFMSAYTFTLVLTGWLTSDSFGHPKMFDHHEVRTRVGYSIVRIMGRITR